MQVSTVLMPLKEKRFNPLTQREEMVDTGMLQEYSAGKPIGAPIKAPSMAPVEQGRAVPSSVTRVDSKTMSVSIHSPDTRNLAQHYQRPGETVQQAAERLADAASRFEVHGGRAFASAP